VRTPNVPIAVRDASEVSAGILKQWLAGQRPSALWVEYDDYAGRVFAGAPADWLMQAVRFANTLGQARKVIPTHVLTVDLTASGIARTAAQDGPAEAALRAVGDEGGRAFGTEVLDALAHKFAGDADLVLKVSSPRDLLVHFGVRGEPSFDELDDLASALAALVRALAERPVSGLLVTRTSEAEWTADEADACEPLFSAARHYGWVSALRVGASLLRTQAGDFRDADILLCADMDAAELAALGPGRKYGGGLPTGYWLGEAALAAAPGQLLYGVIPVDAEPEQIVARCAALPFS